MEGGLEKIQTLEDSLIRQKDDKTVETKGQAPVFTVPLSNIESLREGESAHFEARLTPTDDPKLKVSVFQLSLFNLLTSLNFLTNLLTLYQFFCMLISFSFAFA